jgi:hypothetical protein
MKKIPLKVYPSYRYQSFNIFDPIQCENHVKLIVESLNTSTFEILSKNNFILKNKNTIKFLAISHCVLDENFLRLIEIFPNLVEVKFFNCHFEVLKVFIKSENFKSLDLKFCNEIKFVVK